MGSVTGIPTGNTYAKYTSANPIERMLVAGFLRRLDGAVPPTSGTVVEIGTGEGVVACRVRERSPDAFVVGVDLDDSELAGEWRTRELVGTVADARCLPLRDRSADLILAVEVLEHLDDPAAALAEMARVGRGTVVLSVPLEPLWRMANVARGRYWSAAGNTPGHVQHWGRRSFCRLVARHLEIVEVRQPIPWTMVVAHVP